MVNMSPSWGPEELRDIESVRYWEDMNKKFPGNDEILKKAMDGIKQIGRDNARTPVQWSGTEANAGFTTGKPWIRVHDRYPEINVESQVKDNSSILSFWKQMLKLRKEHADLLCHGRFELYDFDNLETLTFFKHGERDSVLVTLNFTDMDQPIVIPPPMKKRDLELLIANVDSPSKQLTAWEGRVYVVR